jgi:hypothetical protein
MPTAVNAERGNRMPAAWRFYPAASHTRLQGKQATSCRNSLNPPAQNRDREIKLTNLDIDKSQYHK